MQPRRPTRRWERGSALALALVAGVSACIGLDGLTSGSPSDGDGDGGTGPDGGPAARDGSSPCGADTNIDPSNCGRCGVVCPHGARQKALCEQGRCGTECDEGWGDCDEDVANGCERELSKDPSNCGACKRSCAACGEAACTDGACKPTILVSGQTGAYAVALHDTRVHWTNRVYTDGSIWRVEKDGTALENVATGLDAPTELFVDGTYAFFTQPTGRPSGEGVVRIALPDVVGPHPPFVSGQDMPGGLVGDSTGIYWTKNVSSVGSIVRCFGCGLSAATDVATNLSWAGRLALDANAVVAVAGDTIVKVDKTGSNKVTLAISQHNVKGIASNGTSVFVAKDGEQAGERGQIVVVPKAGGEVTSFLNDVTVRALHLDGARLYLAVTEPNKSLRRVEAEGVGRRAVTIARGLSAPGGVVTDAACAYFVDADRVMKVAK